MISNGTVISLNASHDGHCSGKLVIVRVANLLFKYMRGAFHQCSVLEHNTSKVHSLFRLQWQWRQRIGDVESQKTPHHARHDMTSCSSQDHEGAGASEYCSTGCRNTTVNVRQKDPELVSAAAATEQVTGHKSLPLWPRKMTASFCGLRDLASSEARCDELGEQALYSYFYRRGTFA